MFEKIFAQHTQIAERFKQFKTYFSTCFQSDEPLLAEIIHYYLARQGKMIRPLVWMMLDQIMTTHPKKDVTNVQTDFKQAAAIEMIHMATLLHDDVIDQAEFRRHQPSVRHVWGNTLSILAGDFLSARALMLVADDPSLGYEFSHCMSVLAEGEVSQMRLAFNIDLSINDYLKIIEKKTASLFELIGKIVCHTHSASPEICTIFSRYGYYVGMIFQLSDDLLDYQSSDHVLGKPSGHDLVEGKITLPLILGMQASSTLKTQVESYIKKRDDSQIRLILSHFHQTTALSQAQQYLQNWRKAVDQILSGSMLDQDEQQTLLNLVDQLID